MIVIVVVSILTVLAYPNYQTQMTENRRTDGQRILLEIMNDQQKFYSQYSRYTTDLVATDPTIGLGRENPNGDGSVPSDNDFYLVTAQACASLTINECVLLTATPQGGQVGDGNLTYNSRNEKTPATHW